MYLIEQLHPAVLVDLSVAPDNLPAADNVADFIPARLYMWKWMVTWKILCQI